MFIQTTLRVEELALALNVEVKINRNTEEPILWLQQLTTATLDCVASVKRANAQSSAAERVDTMYDIAQRVDRIYVLLGNIRKTYGIYA